MWLFDIILKPGNSVTFALSDESKANTLFNDIQSWISNPDSSSTIKCMGVRTADNRNVIIRTDSIIAVEIKTITDYQYQLKYGPSSIP